jgi:hypothetical protein
MTFGLVYLDLFILPPTTTQLLRIVKAHRRMSSLHFVGSVKVPSDCQMRSPWLPVRVTACKLPLLARSAVVHP